MCVGAMRVGAGQQLWYVRVQRPGCGVKCASGGVVVRGWLSLRRAGGSMRRAGLVFAAAWWWFDAAWWWLDALVAVFAQQGS